MSQTIICPSCSTEIEVTETLSLQLRKQIEGEMNAKVKKLNDELAAEKEKIKDERTKIEKEFEEKLKKDKLEMWEKAKAKAKEEQDLKLKDMTEELKEKDAKLKEAQEQELVLRKKQRELEEKEKQIELEMQRKLDTERIKIETEAKKKASEEERMKLLEKDKQLDMMKAQIEELKRKSEQGSMQIQGEVQEEDLKALLKATFPLDQIDDVPTGINGADLVQTVNTNFGKKAGVIVWESKNTKAFSTKWVTKLKDDRLKVKADVCMLVTQTLPEGLEGFTMIDGVWVSDYKSALQLVTVLRQNLIQLLQVKTALMGQDEKMNALYTYLSGQQFKSRIENIVGTFTVMKDDLEKEKRLMKKHWAKRESEIERIIDNTVGMHGDLQGIMGNALPSVKSLELDFEEESEEIGDEEITLGV